MSGEYKRYYWLKLDQDFFEDDTIDYIESLEGGEKYVLFYLKLCCKALKYDGKLIRYIGNTLIPYDEAGLAKLTKTDLDVVKSAVRIFTKIGLIEQLDTGEIFISQLNEMVGSESEHAKYVRQIRQKQKIGHNVTLIGHNVTQNETQKGHDKNICDLEIEKELDKDIDKDIYAKEDVQIHDKCTPKSKDGRTRFSRSSYEECMNLYYQNRLELSKTQEVDTEEYDYLKYQGIIRPYFVKYGVDKTILAVKNSIHHSWIKKTTYNLTSIFNKVMFEKFMNDERGYSGNYKSFNQPQHVDLSDKIQLNFITEESFKSDDEFSEVPF